jgi:cytochrome c556
MSITSAVSEAVTAISIWLNPERKEKIILRKAIGAAEELLKIYRKETPYDTMPVHRVMDLEVHYRKQWLAWKDGIS